MAKTCSKCHSENTDTQRFCGECGEPLEPAGDIAISRTRTIESPREELTTGGVFAGRYQVIEELGRGGMGRVYRALDRKINEEVALKLIKPEIASEKRTLERFANELKAARRVAHKNVGRMYHLSEDQGTHYITMEYVRGEDLKRMIRMSKQLSIATAVGIARQVADGLAEAHRQGIVHRDLKPGNIMIDREGEARIMDFGIARLLSAKGITGAGVAVGTPDYMPPEQAEGKDVDGRADIYSLGIILYEMVTGRVPFEGETAQAVGHKQRNERPVSPRALNPQVSEDLDGLILKCLEKSPEARFQTADELRSVLERIEQGLPTTTRTPPTTKRTPLKSREITIKFTARKLVVPGLAILALAGAVVLAVIFLPHRAPLKKAGPVHRQITFTGTASSPAISPDGKFVAYTDKISANEQKVVVQDMVGGQALEVGRGRQCGGLRWSPDGSEIAFHGQKSDGSWAIWIVPRLGGRARRLDGIYGAAWSPDGSQLASWSDDKKELSFTNKTTGESRSMKPGGSIPPYAYDIDWSPSGKLILLAMYDDDEACSLWIVAADGSGQTKIMEGTEEWYNVVRWSPRGDVIYYIVDRWQTADIWKIPVSPDTGKPSKPPAPILEGLQIGESLTLTENGKTLAYTRENWSSNLFLASLEGPGKPGKVVIKQLTTGTLQMMAPSLSPDGKLVAYGQRGGESDTMNIFVVPAEGGTPQQVTFMSSWNFGPVWSPDGKEIAFGSNQGGATRIWTVSAAGGPPRRFDKAEGMWPSWAPGPKILYQAGSGLNLMALDPATGEVVSLFKADGDWQMLFPAWAPDGKKIVVRLKRGSETSPSIWVLSSEGSAERMIGKGPSIPIGWSADGRWVYACDQVSGGIDVLAISPEDSRREVLFTIPLGTETGRSFLRPSNFDGSRLVFEGRRTQSDVWVVDNFDPGIKQK